ncbi:hypothetical protein V1291_003597 [Nitrobacteraceae bacterium AZCC 1564]
MHASLVSYGKQYDHHSAVKIAARASGRKAVVERRLAIGQEELDRRAKEKSKAIAAAYDAVSGGTASQEQRDLVNKTEDATRQIQRTRNQQSALDRIYVEGWNYPGSDVLGLVAGKAHQGPQTVFGLASENDPILKRVIASAGKPKRRDKETGEIPKNALRTGPSSDKCWRQMKPLVAHDETYFNFSVNCIDMWRHDLDRDKAKGTNWLYDSEEHMIADLHHKYAIGALSFVPQFAVYTPDDFYPGKIVSAHVYYMLPDDGIEGHGTSGVWRDQKRQLGMLDMVQAKLNDQLGADPGGLANPYNGKHPTGPHNRYVRINTTHLPTLGEMFEGLDCRYSRREMGGIQGRKRLANIGLDPDASNSFWIVTSEEARAGVRIAYKGDQKLYRKPEHAERAFDVAWAAMREHVKASGKNLPPESEEVLYNLLEGCIKSAIEDFKPDLVNRAGYNPGAAAHLMRPTDSAEERMSKGQSVGAASKVRHSKRLIAEAIASIEAECGEITVSEVSRRSGRGRKCCAHHMFEAHVARIASQMLAIVRSTDNNTPPRPGVRFQGGVWGVQTTGKLKIKPSRPQQIIVEHAHHPDDIPIAWRPPNWEEWKQQKLLEYGRTLRSGRTTMSGKRRRTTGSDLIDFVSSSSVTRYVGSESGRKNLISSGSSNHQQPTGRRRGEQPVVSCTRTASSKIR